jgi:hypothetical protein
MSWLRCREYQPPFGSPFSSRLPAGLQQCLPACPPPPSPLPVCLRSNFPPARPSHRSYPPSPPPVLRSPDCNGSPAVCRIYTKGAPEIVLERCSHVLGPDGRRQPLPDEQKRQLLAGFAHGGQRWAGRGGRL